MFKAILFDLDGTLIDSEPWHKKAELEILRSLGLDIVHEDIAMYVGNTMPVMLAGLNERFSCCMTLEDFVEAQKPVLGKYVEEHIELFPDVPPCLDRLNGHATAVVTSSLEWYVLAVRKKLGTISHLFETLVCQKDVQLGKPHPEPYLLASERLGVAPGDCLVIEDSVNGVRSGKAAGCYVVGIDREGHGHLVEADRVVASLEELF